MDDVFKRVLRVVYLRRAVALMIDNMLVVGLIGQIVGEGGVDEG